MVVYKNRALPLAWLVAEGSRGHFSQDCHLTLIRQVKEIVPEDADETVADAHLPNCH